MNWLDELDKQGKAYKNRAKGESEKHGVGTDSACKTPGMRIRSSGYGRGLARGGGRGPIGVPYGR